MSGNIKTREFSISDYDAALELWQRVEGLEIAEGDEREGVSHFLARNPSLSRVATDGAAIIGVGLADDFRGRFSQTGCFGERAARRANHCAVVYKLQI